jgi:glutaredoxin
MSRAWPAAALALLAALGSAHAQQLYRWTDDKGRTHITDTPPPSSAKDVQRKSARAGPGVGSQLSHELAQAQAEFPVVLYTTPACGEPCERARALLNRRAVPFREVLITDATGREELKRVASGAEQVPVMLVGRSVHKGFQPDAYQALLDSARYPKTGVLPPRAQAAPKAPDAPSEDPEPAPTGPYAPRFSK